MDTIDRIEKVKQWVARDQKTDRGSRTRLDTIIENIAQLLNICSNQEAEISLLKQQVEKLQVEAEYVKVDIKWLTNNTSPL